MRCFIDNHPDHPVTVNYRTKEFAIVDYVRAQFPNRTLILNKSVGVSQRRPDILITLDTHSVIIEVDENMHCGYCDEAERLAAIYHDLGGTKPMSVIRFNPDGYMDAIDSGKVKSCWGTTVDKTFGVVDDNDWQCRLETLRTVVDSCLTHAPTKPIAEHRLFYGSMETCPSSSSGSSGEEEEGVEVPFESLGLN